MPGRGRAMQVYFYVPHTGGRGGWGGVGGESPSVGPLYVLLIQLFQGGGGSPARRTRVSHVKESSVWLKATFKINRLSS